MSELPNTPYHIGPQSASVLIAPIEAELARLHRRLVHYHDRLRMDEGDRARLGRARDVLATAIAGIEATTR